MIWKLVLFSVLTSAVHSQCTVGCLKCNTNNTCIFCDVMNSYFLTNSTCVQGTLSNCQTPNQDGTCSLCQNSFYVDPNTKKCIAVPTANLITGCLQYNQQFACNYCNTGFTMSMGTCIPTNITLPGCAFPINNVTCGQCSPGYMASYNTSGCIAIPSIPNCLAFSFGQCSTCSSNFYFNQNYYLSNIYSSIGSFISNSTTLSSSFQPSVCQPITATNCLNATSATTCNLCSSGYHLEQNQCVQDPKQQIPNCAIYQNLNTCLSCANGFYLSNNACTAVTAIVGCVQYNGAAGSSVCTMCNSTAYLSNNGCVNRTASLSIANCNYTSVNSDTCGACRSGFAPTADSTKCLPDFGACLQYTNPSTLANPVCALCVNKQYPQAFNQTAVCQWININGCLVNNYNIPNQCVTCDSMFVLNQQTKLCMQSIPIQNCTQYDSANLNVCLQCAPGTKLFQIVNYCDSVSVPQNCATYNSANGCTSCVNGFYLNSGSCTQIPVSWGPCSSANNNAQSCTLCAPGYGLYTTSSTVCTQLPDYLSANCQTWNNQLGSLPIMAVPATGPNNWCQGCSLNTKPTLGNNIESICVNQNNLYLYPSYSAVYGCLRYGLSRDATPRVICMECQTGYYISGYWSNVNYVNPISCVYGCPTSNGQNVIILDDFFGFRGICVPSGTGAGQINYPQCAILARFAASLGPSSVASAGSGAYEDLVCVTPSSLGFLYFDISGRTNAANSAALYQIQTATATVTNLNLVASDVLPYTNVETGFAPSVFNYRGIPAVAQPLAFYSFQATPNYASNCDYFFQIGLGSAYAANTGYSPASGSVHSCLRCQFGFQLNYTVGAATGNANTPSCISMGATCTSSSIIYGGLPSFVASLLSCHKCATNTFPTVWMDQDAFTASANNPGLLLQYSFPAISGSTTTAPHGFRCAAAPTTVTTANSAPTNGAQVANCAAYAVLNAITTASTVSNVFNSYCIACQTNFYPVYPANTGITAAPNYLPSYIVTQCVASANCDTANTFSPFNSCGRCSTASDNSSPPVFYAFSDYRLINCLPSTVRNCFILNASGNDAGSNPLPCLVCKAGLHLNSDGYCESFNLPNQAVNARFSRAYLPLNIGYKVTTMPAAAVLNRYMRVHHLWSYFTQPYGVSGCASNYVQVPPNFYAPIFCTGTDLFNYNYDFTSSTSFVNSCTSYNATLPLGSTTLSLSCLACTTGKLPNQSGRGCFPSIANCLIVQTANTALCQVCASGYYNVNGVCSNQAIANCQTIATTTNQPAAAHTCAVCAPTYVLNQAATACTAGNIANCAQYQQNSPNVCTSCLPNYSLAILANSVTYCFPLTNNFPICQIASSFNAQTSVGTGFQNSQIICSDCRNTQTNFYTLVNIPSPADRSASICLPFPTIPNCAQYDTNGANLFTSKLLCSACNSGYFLITATGLCQQRTVTPTQCTQYSPNQDICQACAPGFYLDNAQTACIPNPTGILNCQVYSDNKTCTGCVSGFFLANNITCNQSTAISNCVSYSANYTCTKCASGFYLFNATFCNASQAANCLTNTNYSACASCASGYGLSTTSGVTSCVVATVSNCDVPTTISPFTCITCSTGFFLNNGTCVAVPALIQGCVYYDSNVTCSRCQAGSLLSLNRTSCNATLANVWSDANCLNSTSLATPVCSVCSVGYMFVNGGCTGCSNNTIAQGCAMCDPNNSSACLWCSSGLYMNSSQQCVQPINNSTNNPNQTNNTPVTPTPGSAYKLITGVILLFSLVFGVQ